MKTRKFLWTLLPVAAALMMTSCSSEDDLTTVTPKPGTDPASKVIPYTVTVGQGGTTTRASVDADGTTLRFAAGDKLYVRNAAGDIYGCLTLQSGVGTTDGATFSGDLYYNDNEPTAETALTATLVGENDQLANVSGDKFTGFKTGTTGNVCATLADAVQKFSRLQGESTYGAANFALTQGTAFMKFKVVLEDGTLPTDNAVAVTVKDGNTTLGTGTTVAGGTAQFIDTYAEFILPVAGGTSISSAAKMWVGSVGSESDESIAFGASSATTVAAGTVYSVADKLKDFVRLWADGPVWATRNLGATSVTGYGHYYTWAGTTPVDDTTINLDWNENCPYWVSGRTTGHPVNNTFVNYDLKLSKYVHSNEPEYWGGDGEPDGKSVLDAEDDAAYVATNGSWRMPTRDELVFSYSATYSDPEKAGNQYGLPYEATYEWTTVNEVAGGKFTGKGAYSGKAVFLPAAGARNPTKFSYQGTRGLYLSSSLRSTNSCYALYLYFSASAGAYESTAARFGGLTVRPVR